MLLYSISHPLCLGLDAVDLVSDVGSEDPLSLQMGPSDPRFRINTLEPINGAEPVFLEMVIIFGHNIKRKSFR